MQCYYIVLSAKFNAADVDKKNLDQSETLLLLKQVIKQLYQMIAFSFQGHMSLGYKALKEQNFFMNLEVLYGKSMVDLHLNEEGQIKTALDKGNQYIQSIAGSILDHEISYHKERVEIFKGNGLWSENLAVSLDFDFVSQIERGLDLNAHHSINLLINKIFEINDYEYQSIIMMVLPKILKQESIQIILPFF